MRSVFDDVIEACARIAESDPEPGPPPPALRQVIDQADRMELVNAAVRATKRSIARRIRELKVSK